jgi:hypothetical protein
VDRLSRDPRFGKVLVLEVDFDSSKELLRRCKGKTETLRSTGVTDPEGIRKIFEASL